MENLVYDLETFPAFANILHLYISVDLTSDSIGKFPPPLPSPVDRVACGPVGKGIAPVPTATHMGGPVNPWMVWVPTKGGGTPGHRSTRDPTYPIRVSSCTKTASSFPNSCMLPSYLKQRFVTSTLV